MKRTLARRTIVTTAAALAAAVLSGCAERTCVVRDVSGSTRFAQVEYAERLDLAATAAAEGGGSIVAFVVTGDPIAESDAVEADFAGLDGVENSGQRMSAVSGFVADVEDEVASAATGTPSPGSGVVAAISLLDGRSCDSVLVLSEGYETSDFDIFEDDIISGAGRQAILDRLEEIGRIPELDGADVAFPFGGYVPQGTRLSKERRASLDEMFEALAARAGADSFSWRR